MRCPYCSSTESQVKDSRPTEDDTAIRRRRVCNDCGGRFTTFERVQLRELTVAKKSGKRVPFDRDKLTRSVQTALRKRDVDPERVERMITGIVRQLESRGEGDIPSEEIGMLVMDGLKQIDEVAYVRFASVYKDFQKAEDFEGFLHEMEKAGEELAPGYQLLDRLVSRTHQLPANHYALISLPLCCGSHYLSRHGSGSHRQQLHGCRHPPGAAQ